MKSTLKNRTIFTRDNLEVMRGMADSCIDLIYLDPPFNSKHNYAAPIGSQAAGAEFKDTWTLSDIKEAWYGEIADTHPGLYDLLTATRKIHGKSMMAYLIYMAIRVIEIRRILKNGGGVWLHCDPTASHYLKLTLDDIFGKQNFRNEVVWCYTGPSNTKRWFPRKHDVILYYAKTENALFNGNAVRIAHKSGIHNDGTMFGKTEGDSSAELRQREKQGKPVEDWWSDIGAGAHIPSKERTGYPTQKPLKLLERIIKACSNEGDMVLDPFCGCATTCVAAEKLDRQWVGIDVSPLAAKLVQARIERELGVLLFDPIHRTDIPQDRDGTRSKDIKHILYGKQEGKCTGCLTHFPFQNFTVDHIVPKSKGGPNTDENLQLLCGYCNSVKGDRTQEYLISKVRSMAG